MIFLFVPETKQRTLEELDYIFAIPTRTFVHYQLTKTLPYWFRRGILFDKTATLEPLYRFETSSDFKGTDSGDDKAVVEATESLAGEKKMS